MGGIFINRDFGNDRLVLSAIADIVTHFEIISSDLLRTELLKIGFDRDFLCDIFSKYKFMSTVNLKDIDLIFTSINYDYAPIVVTYPAYDNRGVPKKIGNSSTTSGILDGLSAMMSSATREIIIISPYIEEDGIVFFEDVLKRKIQKGVVINIVLREYNDNSVRRDKLITWIRNNMSDADNFRLYNYHYVSAEGKIESTCHAKIVSIDGQVAYVGSADIKKRAYKLNFEMGTINTGYIGRHISLICKEIVNVSERIFWSK